MEDEIPVDFSDIIVWALDRILKDEYEPSADDEGHVGLLLGPNVGPRNKPVDLAVVEEALKECLSQEKEEDCKKPYDQTRHVLQRLYE